MKFYAAVLSLFLMACGSNEKVSSTGDENKASANFDGANELIYRQFPDGRTFKFDEKEYFPDGRLKVHTRYVSRKEDTSYVYGIGRRVICVYDSQNRMVGKEVYQHFDINSDSLKHIEREYFENAADSMAHYHQYMDWETGEPQNKVLKDISWFDDGRLVQQKRFDGYRDNYVLEKWNYEGDTLKSYLIDNWTTKDTVRYGETILSYQQREFLLNEEGIPVSDEAIWYSEFDRSINSITKSYYDTLGTIYKTDVQYYEEVDGESVPDPSAHYVREQNPNKNRGTAPNPNLVLDYLASSKTMEQSNFMDGYEKIAFASYTYDESGRIVTQRDSLPPSPNEPGAAVIQNHRLTYDDNGRLIERFIEVESTSMGRRDRKEIYKYHENGTLEMGGWSDLFEPFRTTYRIFSDDGTQIGGATCQTLSNGVRDSVLYQFDPLRGHSTAEATFADGVACKGYFKLYDERGNLLRDFNERENDDAQYFYDDEGNLFKSSYYKVYYNPIDGVRSTHQYDLLFQANCEE